MAPRTSSARATRSPSTARVRGHGYLAEVAKVTDEEYEGWKRDYPEAFARDYDPAIGINRKSWVIEK